MSAPGGSNFAPERDSNPLEGNLPSRKKDFYCTLCRSKIVEVTPDSPAAGLAEIR